MLQRGCEALRIEGEKVRRGPRLGGQMQRHLWVYFRLSHSRGARQFLSEDFELLREAALLVGGLLGRALG